MPTTVAIGPMVDLLAGEFAAIDALVADLDEEQFARPTCLPGWTVKDQLAHVMGTERMLEGEPAPTVEVAHLPHLRAEFNQMIEVWVEDQRPASGAEVRERFRAVTAARVAKLRAMTQEEFDAPSWTPVGADETYGRFMRIRHYDMYLHEHDMRDALGAPDRAEAADVASALTETEPGLGYIVGRKAALPDGSQVRIELTGPVPTTYDLVVDGRAKVVDALDGEPTVGIRLPAMTWLRLTGGRVDPEPLLGGEVELLGDAELARRLGSNLAITI